jgi:hypothetical protein
MVVLLEKTFRHRQVPTLAFRRRLKTILANLRPNESMSRLALENLVTTFLLDTPVGQMVNNWTMVRTRREMDKFIKKTVEEDCNLSRIMASGQIIQLKDVLLACRIRGSPVRLGEF